MTELHLPICATFFSLLLCIVFFCKKRLWLIENKIYGVMLITGFLDSLIVSIERILVMDGNINAVTPMTNVVLQFTNKLDFGVLIIFTTCAFLYTLLITYPKVKDSINSWITGTIVLDIFVYFIILLLDVNLIAENNIISVSGSSIVLTYVFGGLYLIVSMLMAIINIKRLTIRHIPIMTTIFISFFLVIIFIANPYIMLISIVITFVNYLMFFTIENPDIQMIDELTKTKELAEKYNNDKSIFLFNMTQQIRHPLNIIEQSTEKILESKHIEDIEDEVFELKNAQKRISHIINGVLDVSTIDAKKIKVFHNQYNVRNLLKDISIRAERAAASKNLEFRKNFDEGLPELLYGDSIRIKQIINAILINSVKYTEKGFIELNVNSIVTFDVCRLIISIKDSGIGMKTEEINKLFEKKDDKELDLSKIDDKEITLDIAKKMVNLIGGTITVQSEKNKGSEFILVIDEKIVTDNTKISKLVEDYKKINNKNKILFVSDNKTQVSFYKKRLESTYLLEIAKSGQECLNRIRKKEEFDLIIISKDMEKLDGIAVMEKLKLIESFDIPAILLVDKNDDKESFSKYKFASVISTNTTQEQLIKKIDLIIKKN